MQKFKIEIIEKYFTKQKIKFKILFKLKKIFKYAK
jgi:hypothetical protein